MLARILALAPALLLPALAAATAAPLRLARPFEVVVGLKLKNLDKLEALFWQVADPKDSEYLQHRTVAQLSELVSPHHSEIDAADAWLRGLGASSVDVSGVGDLVIGRFTSESVEYRHNLSHPLASKWSADAVPLRASHPRPVDFVYRRGGVSPELDMVTPQARATIAAPAPPYSVAAQKEAYGMPLDLQASNADTLQMVWGPGTFGYSKLQLAAFKASQCPALHMEKIQTEGHAGKNGGDNFGEGNLDTRMIASFGLNVSTIVSNTNTSMACEEGNGFGLAMLDFVTDLAAREVVPQVLSLSLGSLSAVSCNMLCDEAAKLGTDLKECQAYLQKQRQVCMFTGTEQVGRINVGLQMLGLRGVSVFGSSGDGGSHWSFQQFNSGSAIGRALNKVGCKFMFPIFPSPSPFMMSVGGTSWKEGDGANPIAWSGSGGGFAWQFAQPAHQKAAVGQYLSSTSGLPPPSSYNASGRGYPDLSAVAVMGTSESSPTVAGIFSMLMDHRLNAGLKPLGFLAPRLWQTMAAHPGVALENIGTGDSKTSCDNGFPASKSGWDPVTGWGRPKWAGLLQLFGSDDTLTPTAA